MSWSAPPNTSSILLYDHDLYIWIYEYILNYLLRFIVPFISLSIVVFRTNMALTPVVEGYCSGDSTTSSISGLSSASASSASSTKMGANRCQLMSIGACLLALVCYAPFLVNYAIYAAWILDDSAAAAAAVADDLSVRKFNTFCYVFIMAGSAFRIAVYALFNPKLLFRNSCCCQLGGVAKRKLFGAQVDRYGRVIGHGTANGVVGNGVRTGNGVHGVNGVNGLNNAAPGVVGSAGLSRVVHAVARNGSAPNSMNGYDNQMFRY